MGLVSSDLQNIVNQLGKAKNSINTKYDIMRNNNANAQEDITHLYIDELSPSIDKIECLNSYDASLDDSKVLEGTKFYSNGKEVIGTMPINQEIDVTLDINHVLQQIPLGYIPGTKVNIQLQEKQCIPSTINQEITPDDKYVLSKVTVAGDENLKPENIKKDIEIFGITGELISLPLREKIFKLSKNKPIDESPSGTYQDKITAEIEDYHIVYIANIHGQQARIQNVKYNDSFNIITDFPVVNQEGQVLSGWSSDANDTTIQYASGQLITNNLSNRGDVALLYAVWKDNQAPTVPIINMIPAVEGNTVKDGRNVSFTAQSTDPENNDITYEWLIDDIVAEPSAKTYSIGTHTVKCRAKDSYNAISDWASLTFTVKQAPAITLSCNELTNGNFDIIGTVNNGGETIKTTFGGQGYATVVKIINADNTTQEITLSNTTQVINNVILIRNTQYSEDTNYVTTTYTAQNDTDEIKIINIAVHSDVMIGSNDRASIYKVNTGLCLKDETKDYQFYIYLQNIPGVTNVSTKWIGLFNNRQANIWNESTEALINDNQTDTGMAFSWQNITLLPHTQQTFTFILNVE